MHVDIGDVDFEIAEEVSVPSSSSKFFVSICNLAEWKPASWMFLDVYKICNKMYEVATKIFVT